MALLVRSRKAERLAQHERRGSDSPHVIAPALYLHLNLATQVSKCLLSYGGYDRVEKWVAEVSPLTTDDQQLWIEQGDHVGVRQHGDAMRPHRLAPRGSRIGHIHTLDRPALRSCVRTRRFPQSRRGRANG